jgi:L-alanine-DL-glutamate epimerase-like enolase superfamily enzyme
VPARTDALPIESVRTASYTIPTDEPESDGTFEWNATTIVVVEVEAAGRRGIGYSYTDRSAAVLIESLLAARVRGLDAIDVPSAFAAMLSAVRNVGRPGVASSAIAAVDTALWDLKAKILGVSLAALLGSVRDSVPVYGSGGFTSYAVDRLREQLGGWAEQGIAAVKMKIGREPERDAARVMAARRAIGDRVDLFVDANGAYSRKQALEAMEPFADLGVRWFEEPVSSDDLEGLRLLRDRGPGGMDVAAGEYGYDVFYFRRMLEAGAVDVLQADATRCAGITGFSSVGALCDAFALPLSAHTAPTIHAHVCCALPRVRHVEYFYDHVRIERMLFDGAATAVDGRLRPDRSRPGLGIELKRRDAERFAA